MHRIYRATQRILAAQILSIAMPPVEPGAGSNNAAQLLLTVDTGEQFNVPATWASSQGVQAGGYLGLLGQHEQGQAVFIPASVFPTAFEYLGDVPQEPVTGDAPEGAKQPEAGGAMVSYARSEPATYDFDAFVQYGINAGGNIVRGFPWSFEFYGRGVTHLSDDEYLITNGTVEGLRFKRGEILHVSAPDCELTVLSSGIGQGGA